MRKINLLLVLISIICFASRAEQIKSLELKTLKAPFFTLPKSSAIETFSPKVVKNNIIYGNKRLEILNNGQMRLYNNNKILAKLYSYFIIADSKTKKKYWFRSDSQKYFDKKNSKLSKLKDGFEYNGAISAGALKGKIKQSIIINKDGLLEITVEWFGASQQLQTDSFMIEIPEEQINGGTIVVNGKKYKVPEKPKYGFFSLWRTKNHQLSILSDDPTKKFDINTKENSTVLGWRRKDRLAIRLYRNKNTNKLIFTLDLRKGLRKKQRGITHGGIDFKAIDDLCLPDQQASVNLMRNPSFEQGLSGYKTAANISYQVGSARWNLKPLQIDNKDFKFGNSSLKMTINPGQKYPVYTPPVVLSKGKYTFSYYLKGENEKKQKLCLHIPGTRWTVGSPWSCLPDTKRSFKATEKWTRHAMTFDIPASMPVRFLMYLQGNGSIWLDGMQLEKGSKATKFVSVPFEGLLLSSSPNNVIDAKNKYNTVLRITGRTQASGTAQLEVKSFFGDKLYNNKFNFKCNNKGIAELKLPFASQLPLGFYIIKATYKTLAGKSNYDFHRLIIMKYLKNEYRLKNIFANDYGALKPLFANFKERIKCWQQIGIGARTHLHNWDKVVSVAFDECNIKVFDSSMLHRIKRNGKRYYTIRSSQGRSYDTPGKLLINDFRLENSDGKLTDDYLCRFKKAVSANVRNHPWIKMWSFGGENGAAFPDLAGLIATDDEFAKYVKLQVAFYQAVKETAPNCKVSNGAPCNMSLKSGIKLLDRFLTAINDKIKYDYIGVHCYRASPERPDMDANLQALFKVLDKHGYNNTKVFLPEGLHYGPYNIPQWGVKSAAWLPTGGCWYHGSLSNDVGWAEKMSSALLSRSWLIALKHQNRLTGVNGGLSSTLFMDMKLTPGTIQKTINTLAHILGNAKFKKDIKIAPYVRCYIFEDSQKRPIATIWNHHPAVDAGTKKSILASASFNGNLSKVLDLMECERAFENNKKGNVNFPISSFPLFLIGKVNSLSAFTTALEKTEVISGGVQGSLAILGLPLGPDKIKLLFENYNRKTFDGNITIGKTKYKLTVPSFGKCIKTYSIPKFLTAKKIKQISIPVILSTANYHLKKMVNIRGFHCKKTKYKINIDGNISDWQDIPAIKLTDRWQRNIKQKIRDDDFSGWFKTAWSSEGLFLCVKITDDKFVHHEYPQTCHRWSNDSLQLYFDSLADARTRENTGYDENDYEYAVFPNADAKSSVLYRYMQPDHQLTLGTAIPKSNAIANDIPTAFKKIEDGYIYEVFFPAKYLLPTSMKSGTPLGFGMYINDRDNLTNKTKSALTLAGKGNGCYKKPHLWPIMVLSE